MRRILMVSPTPSHPASQGNRRRVHEICRFFLEQGDEVHFLWMAEEWRGLVGPDALAEMRDFFTHFFVLPPGDRQPQIDYLSDALASQLSWLQTNYDYDIVWTHYAWFAAVCDAFAPFPSVRVIDTHDKLADRDQAMQQENISHANFFSLSQEKEATALAKADLVVGCQPEDSAYFRTQYNLHTVRTVGQPMTALELPDRIPSTSDGAELRVGLIGSNNAVNREALARILSLLVEKRASLPTGFTFVLAGRMIESIETVPHEIADFIEIMGVVERPEDFYASLDAVIVPLAFGTGLKVKSVEALASGLPVFATEHAMIGLPVSRPEHRYQSEADLLDGLITFMKLPARADMQRDLTAASKQAFEAYKTASKHELLGLIDECDALKSTRAQRGMLPPDGLSTIDAPFYIYGAGQGANLVWSSLTAQQKSRVLGFIDQNPPVETLFDKPVLKPDAIKASSRKKAAILVALMTAEAEAVRVSLEAKGWQTVYSARQFLRQRMTETHQSKQE